MVLHRALGSVSKVQHVTSCTRPGLPAGPASLSSGNSPGMYLLQGADAAVFANGHKTVRSRQPFSSAPEDFLKADTEMTEITNQ